MNQHIAALLQSVQPERQAIVHHPLFAQLEQPAHWARFMEYQAFAIWDAVHLTDRICQQLSPAQAEWLPRVSPEAGYLMSQLCAGNPLRLRHFVQLMEQMGASTAAMQQVDFYQRQGTPLPEALEKMKIPEAIQQFVLYTFYTINQLPVHAQVAMLLLGREDLLMDTITPALAANEQLSAAHKERLEAALTMPWRCLTMSPAQLAVRLLTELCGEEQVRWTEATQAVRQSLIRRARMMDALHHELSASRPAQAAR